MKQYIFTSRNGVHIIDLETTVKLAREAADFVRKLGREHKTLVFVGTKRQAKDIIKNEAKRCGALYVSERWVGGLLTNFSSIYKTIKKYNEMFESAKGERFANLSEKEQALFQKEFSRIDKLVGGIKELKTIPDALFILDVKREKIAITEAKRVNIPAVAICDTNSDPELVDYPIPGNDDALKSIAVLVSYVADAYLEGKKEAETLDKNAEAKKKTEEKAETKKED
jgi:small subunit ribosomal protein S2